MQSALTPEMPCSDGLVMDHVPFKSVEKFSNPVGIISYIERQYINNIWPHQATGLFDQPKAYCPIAGIQQEALMEFIRRQEKVSKNLAKFADRKSLDRRINMLGEFYIFRRPEDVYALLHEDVSLMEISREAYEKIRKYFVSEDLFVEIFSDPNSPNSKELVISISTNLAPEEAIEKLNRFDEDWWLNASMNYDSNVCIKLEYK